jgi:quinolinate synthase
VVALSDANGSTEFICRYVKEAPPGSTIYIGTEINLVSRIARENPDKKIYELARSLCPNMFRIDLPKLLWVIDQLGFVNVVRVDPVIKEEARLALERMLTLH